MRLFSKKSHAAALYESESALTKETLFTEYKSRSS